MTTRIVARLFPSVPFVGVVGKQDDVPHKPDPTSARKLAVELRTDPREIAFLGDSDADIGAALGAGMMPIGVAWGYRTREHLRLAGAVRVLEHPIETLGLLG
jgi:phosphoglycolate phosphatase